MSLHRIPESYFRSAGESQGSGYKAGELGLPPVGLPHVIVNGVFVKRDNQATDALPGLALRCPVEDKSRHIPATQQQWLNTFTIDDSSIGVQ